MEKYTTQQLALRVLGYTLSELAFKDYDDIAQEAEEHDHYECECCEKWVDSAHYDEENGWCDDCKTYIDN